MNMKKKFFTILALALGFSTVASADCLDGCVNSPPPSYNSALGATTFGGINSATAGHATGSGIGATVKTETLSMGDEFFTLGADVNYKVDAAPNCTGCGDQVARVFLNGEQKVGAFARNTAANPGAASSRSATGTAAAFQGTVGVKWGSTLPR